LTPQEYAANGGHTELAEFLQELAEAQLVFLRIFPPEIFMEIFSHLDLVDLCSVSMVCKLFNRVSCDNRLWYRFCAKFTPNTLPPDWRTYGGSLKQLYVDAYRRCGVDERINWSVWEEEVPKQMEHDYLVKIVLLGNRSCGKSSYLYSLFGEPMPPLSVGIDFVRRGAPRARDLMRERDIRLISAAPLGLCSPFDRKSRIALSCTATSASW
jgi:hypothetical protein